MIASFTAEELTITDEDIGRAIRKELEGHQRAIAHAESMIEFIESQKAHEGENLTTGEAMKRAQEGGKHLREIVGDE